MTNMLTALNDHINDFVWGPFMLILLLGTGIYLTVRTKFFQLSKFGRMLKCTLGSLFSGKKKAGKISPFQAMSTALAGTIGVGNIVGIATAITMGGPGAVFWMWVSAFFGMMTKYAEVALAVRFRGTYENGQHYGGPMLYIEKGLHMKWLAYIFSVLCALASFGIGNMTQSNAISGALSSSFQIPPWISGIVVAVVIAAVILGGVKRITKVTSTLVPIMSIFYIVGALIVLIINHAQIPAAFALIFQGAFRPEAAAGGVIGFTVAQAMRFGFARGVFTNEAGLGSAPIAHAVADTDNPVEQGLWGMFEVFVDTIVVCTMTALVLLSSGLWNSGVPDTAMAAAAFAQAFGTYGGYFIAIATTLFAISTLLGWSMYGEHSVKYLCKNRPLPVLVYRSLFIFLIVVGATIKIELAWDISDTLNGLMAIPNLIGLVGLSGLVIKMTKDYVRDPASVLMRDAEVNAPLQKSGRR
ncbi:alanine/glycine:cation symporter family protein [Zongyangia hominis]